MPISHIKYRQTIEQIKKIKKQFILEPFYPRIACLIVHGSALYYPIPNNDDADIDVELVLKTRESDDNVRLKKLVEKFEVKVECQLRYMDEIRDEFGLITRSRYKIFMYFAYSNSLCLIGRNVYSRLICRLKEEEIRQSLLISIQISFKDIRKLFFSGANAYQVNKSIMRTLVGICMIEGLLDWRDLGKKVFFKHGQDAYVGLILKKYAALLNKTEKKIITEFSEHYRLHYLYPPVFSVIDKIMKIFSKRLLSS